MDSSANQWLAELENDELGELEFVDPLSMQQLAESLANELWKQPQEQQEEQANHTYPPSMAGFSFVRDVNKTEGFATAVDSGNSNSMFSFTDGTSGSLDFSALEQQQHGGAAGNCRPLSEKRGGRRAASSVQEHVIAERKRREKMHQQFATLASIVPDITKTDKVSLLDSTIEYVQQLRERVKALQEEQQQSTAESPMLGARCCIGSDDQEDDEATSPSWVSPKIEANVRGTTVLLRIACREKKGALIVLLTELEKHGLSVVNTSVVPFAHSSLNITITAKIEDGSFTTVELVKKLNLALQNF